MRTDPLVPYGALLLRVSLGVMFLAHSLLLKGVTYTLPGTAKFFESLGLPGPLASACRSCWATALGLCPGACCACSRWGNPLRA